MLALASLYCGPLEKKGKNYAFGQKDRTGIVNRSDVSHSIPRSNEWEEYILGKDGNTYFGRYNMAVGGATWNWLRQTLIASNYILCPKHLKKIELPVLLLSAGKDTIVSVKSEKKLAKYAPNCKLVSFPTGKHELLMETDDIRGDGTKKSLEKDNVLSSIVKFLKNVVD
jgi:pimeloyl-ACP methyl ester carboxylesterase